MRIFEKEGPINTKEALDLAIAKAIELNTDIVVATTSGDTAMKTALTARQTEFKGKIITVTHAYGSRAAGKNAMQEITRQELKEMNVEVVTAAHVLSGAERGLSKVHQGIYPIEIMADTLRMISRGVKVCVEISVMANDAGKIKYGKPVVCIGGSRSGADTVCIITPEYASNILKTQIHEIVCMPY